MGSRKPMNCGTLGELVPFMNGIYQGSMSVGAF